MDTYRKIKIVSGEDSPIEASRLANLVYRNLSWRQKLNLKFKKELIANNINSFIIYYHPFWVAKILVFASRPPFPPKKTPYIVFVDGVSGYRGLMSHVPHIKEITPLKGSKIVRPIIDSTEQALRYVYDVQYKQIHRLYMLKKPKQEVKEIDLYYIPFWYVDIQNDYLSKQFIINANTGENESYLKEFWEKGKFVGI